MDHPSVLALHDVRCFQGEQRGRLGPITLLVGENSTGKTTFLGCYSVLHRMLSRGWDFDQQLDFNVEPFSMGSFRDIVRSRRGPSGRINQFKLGLTVPSPSGRGKPPYHLLTTFTEQGSQPVVSSLHFQFDHDSFLEVRRDNADKTILAIPGLELEVDYPDISYVMLLLDVAARAGDQKQPRDVLDDFPEVRPIADYLGQLPLAPQSKWWSARASSALLPQASTPARFNSGRTASLKTEAYLRSSQRDRISGR